MTSHYVNKIYFPCFKVLILLFYNFFGEQCSIYLTYYLFNRSALSDLLTDFYLPP